MPSELIPNGWENVPNNISNAEFDFWKAFPTSDGLQVDIYILKVKDKYQVKDVATSRTSGPTESIHTEVSTLDEAINAAYQVCKFWDDSVSRLLNK